jgi:dipeptidyl aminopeptidase/acylaminoacyl peptidase
LLAAGWAVVAPNAVGSTGYGKRFARRLRGRWGELDLPQYLAVIDQLQREGFTDDRVALAGKSYGGFSTAYAIGHCDRFRAAVVSAPVANFDSHAGTSDSGYFVDPFALGDELAKVPERCQRLSPIHCCASVDAATLLLQGEDDQRCPLGQSEELFARLIRCGKSRVQMVIYPGESHGLAGDGTPAHRLDYHRRLASWVTAHLEVASKNEQGGRCAEHQDCPEHKDAARKQ